MWITRVSINNPVFATMVMAALCVLGLFSYAQLRVERLPDIAPPIVFVAVAYPGASPDATETELTRPIELALNGIAGIKMIRSNSLEGRSETVVEFQLSADMNRAVQEVRDKVATVQPNFPRDAKQPYVPRFDGENAQPTVYLSLLSKDRSARELSLLADQVVRKRLERVDRRRPGRRRRPDGAPGADRPRPAAAARLPADAGRRVAGAAARQLRHAGRPAHRHQGRRDRARRRQDQGRQGVRRRRRRQPQRHGGAARRPRHPGRARARAGLDLAGRRRAGDLVPGLQAAGREHRRDGQGDQGRRRGAEEGPASRRRAAPRLCRQRLGGELARRRQAHADRGRAADDRDRLPVPAQLAQHGDHRPDPADRRDLGVHRGLRCSASR